jgi:predicted molibdopterin-dependent oxidoreductase YjgC
VSWTRLPGAPAFAIRFDGTPVTAVPGQTVAAALWAAGVRSWRTTPRGRAPRGLFCGIGTCFDCLVTIDGEPDQRACLVPARPDQVVTAQPGAGDGL